MVTSQNTLEKDMDYRGSKSVTLSSKKRSIIVKEQRVDGSWHVCLRCTLMGFERNYQVKTLSKQLNIKNFSGLLMNLLINRKAEVILSKFNQKRTYNLTILKDKPYNGSNYINP